MELFEEEPIETDKLEFTVWCDPVAQPRPRAVAVPVKGSKRWSARMHPVTTIKNNVTGVTKPHPIVEWKRQVREAYRLASIAEGGVWLQPFVGPIRVNITFIMLRPQAMCWKTKVMRRYPHIGKPDRDNMDKAVLDALTDGELAWKDDCQVYAGQIEKWVGDGREKPRAIVEVIREHHPDPKKRKGVVPKEEKEDAPF